MDNFFFHPRIVHLPIALAVLMPFVAGGLALAWWRGWLPARTWIVAVLLQAVFVGSAIAALRSGEAEEERVERVVAEERIEVHEEAAEAFTIAGGAVLVVMVAGWFLRRGRPGIPLAAVASAGAFVVLWLGLRTGQAGGELVYEHGAADAYTTPAAGSR